MKFTTTSILLLACFGVILSLTAGLNEPIVEEWVAQGIEGFEKCGYSGKSRFYPASSEVYKFLVWDGTVYNYSNPPNYSSSNQAMVKSFKLPKGYEVGIAAKFVKEKFGAMTEAQKNQIKSIQDGSKGQKSTYYDNESCAVTEAFWYMNMSVKTSSFVDITLNMPPLLTALILAQDANLKKVVFSNRMKTCASSRDSLTTENIRLEREITQLSQDISETKSQVTKIHTQILGLQNIIDNKIDPDQWVSSAKSYVEINNKLKQEIDVNQATVRKMDCQIDAWEDQIKVLESKITVNNDEYNKNQAEFLSVFKSVKLTEFNLAVKEGKIKEKADSYGRLKTDKDNMEQSVAENKRRLLEIQKLIEADEKRLAATTSSLETVRKESNILMDEQAKLSGILKVSLNRRDILNLNSGDLVDSKAKLIDEVNAAGNEINGYKAEIAKVKGAINASNLIISANTADAEAKTKADCEKKIKVFHSEKGGHARTELDKTNMLNVASTTVGANRVKMATAEQCVTSDGNLTKESNSQFELYLKQIGEIYNRIIGILDVQQSVLRNACFDSFSDVTPVKDWTPAIKDKLHNYLNNIPTNTDAIDLVRRRKRRFRRMKRRLF